MFLRYAAFEKLLSTMLRSLKDPTDGPFRLFRFNLNTPTFVP